MMKKIQPPKQGILGHRFRCLDYPEESLVILWDVGDVLQKKTEAEVWCHAEYEAETREKTVARLRFICGVLNGLRDRSEQIQVP